MDWSDQVFGVDVSHHQGAINWPALAAGQGGRWRFAWVKATEGATFKDPRRVVNMRSAHAAGLATGAYHYARPANNSPGAEADNLLAVLAEVDRELALPPVLDLEHRHPTPTAAGISPQELRSWVMEWLGIVAASTGQAPVLYTGSSYMAEFMGTKKPGWQPIPALLWQPRYPNMNWMASPEPLKRPHKIPGMPWAVWQYSTPKGVAGIKPGKRCDVNVTDGATLETMIDGSGMGTALMLGAAAAAAALAGVALK